MSDVRHLVNRYIAIFSWNINKISMKFCMLQQNGTTCKLISPKPIILKSNLASATRPTNAILANTIFWLQLHNGLCDLREILYENEKSDSNYRLTVIMWYKRIFAKCNRVDSICSINRYIVHWEASTSCNDHKRSFKVIGNSNDSRLSNVRKFEFSKFKMADGLFYTETLRTQ